MRRPAPFVLGGSLIIIALATKYYVTTCQALSLLPPRLQRTVAKGLLVQPDGRPNVFVLGTVHVGSESAEEASLLIETVRPSALVVEVSPSRLPLIRKRNIEKKSNENDQQSNTTTSTTVHIQTALTSLPALAQKGWNTGGPGGLIFAIVILWGSLVKRSLTSSEESNTLPRADEFAAAIAAADRIGCKVVAADMEIEDIVRSVTTSMRPEHWMTLGWNVMKEESLGLQESDPIRRKRDESLIQWAERRRDISTARASRAHGLATAPCLSRVLVDERDAIFAQSFVTVAMQQYEGDENVVCVVGLVHLDGVVERIQQL